MTRTYKILSVIAVVLIVTIAFTARFASHNDPCGHAPELPANVERMKAIVVRCYGPPEILKVEEIEKPKPEPDQVLVKVRAASINPLEWHEMRGTPYLMRRERGWGTPKENRLGVDYSGTVEAVGADVTTFKPGDEVFGARSGALAEYVVARESRAILLKPSNVSFEQASTVAIAGLTALQALRDLGKIKAGQKVLINGASGGVGTFAVQIAKAYGAEVTGVCSTGNVELVRSIGADRVIDYKKEDFTKGEERYDLIVDIVSSQPLHAVTRVMQPEGILVIVGNAEGGKWLGPYLDGWKTKLWDRFTSQELFRMRTDITKENLNILREFMEAGKVMPVVDRRYSFNEVPAAVTYLETGRARGKVVIVME